MESPAASVEVRKNITARLYEALIAGQVVGTLAYEQVGGRIALTHSYVDPEQRNHGIASSLARFALEDLRDSQSRAGVYCGFVADYVQEHPEYEDSVEISRSAFLATRTALDTNRGR
jgi:uncharacterized protein